MDASSRRRRRRDADPSKGLNNSGGACAPAAAKSARGDLAVRLLKAAATARQAAAAAMHATGTADKAVVEAMGASLRVAKLGDGAPASADSADSAHADAGRAWSEAVNALATAHRHADHAATSCEAHAALASMYGRGDGKRGDAKNKEAPAK